MSKLYMTRLAAAWCGAVFICLFAVPAVSRAQCPAETVRLDSLLQESAALVFVGTALTIERAGSTEIVTFDVERVWKGPVKERTTVYRPLASTSGNAEPPSVFVRGRNIVIAHHLDGAERRALGIDDREDALGTSTCGDGSRPLASTEPDLGKLGPGGGPIEPQVRVRNPKVVLPIRTKVVAPVYPEGARAAGIRATVLVEITVDQTGRVTNASVLRSIPLLDQAAIDCVMKWEFLPALIYGQPTRSAPVIMTAAVAFPP